MPKRPKHNYRVLELLGVLRRKAKNTLTTYIQLPPAIDRSEGVPRWLNRLGSYVMLKAIESQAETITPKVLQQGLEYAEQQLRGQKGLTPEDYYVLDLVLEKGILSDETITLEDLERIKVKEFGEILPILEKLVQFDLVHRLPSERAAEYTSTPLLSKEPIKKS